MLKDLAQLRGGGRTIEADFAESRLHSAWCAESHSAPQESLPVSDSLRIPPTCHFGSGLFPCPGKPYTPGRKRNPLSVMKLSAMMNLRRIPKRLLCSFANHGLLSHAAIA